MEGNPPHLCETHLCIAHQNVTSEGDSHITLVLNNVVVLTTAATSISECISQNIILPTQIKMMANIHACILGESVIPPHRVHK